MQKIKLDLGQIISSRICEELTSNMEYKSLKLQHERERSAKAKHKAIDFTHQIINQIRQIQHIQAEKTVKYQIITPDSMEKSNQFGFGKRVSILKIRKSLINDKVSSTFRSSKRINRPHKQSKKGLVKLTQQQEDLPSFIQYVDKLRQKKIRYAQAMQEFQDKQKGKQIKSMKSSMKQTRYTDKPFITTFTGELIKCQKKQMNSKKDDIYLQKIKVKPLFKLKEYVYNRSEETKNENMYPSNRRVSISKQVKTQQQSKNKGDYLIKSIIDVITNRSQKGNIRRKRNQIR